VNLNLLIDGTLVPGALSLDVINPATGQVLATCARADKWQLDQAVAAAKRAFPGWAAADISVRKSSLTRIADAMEARADEFARLLTQEQGKPLPEAQFEIGGGVAILRIFAEMDTPLVVRREDDKQRVVEQRLPLGVVATITPWNFPLMLLLGKVAPALMAGNTVVSKPAPTTPLTALLFAEIVAEHVPAGVFNLIVDDNDLGAELTSHPDVAKVSFTGSTATGKRVMESVSSTLKRLTLELGGNDAAIILNDVDVKEVAPHVFSTAMLNAGQVCLATKRVYVPAALYDEMCDELARLAKKAIVDDGMKQGTQIGPVQNRQQYEKMKFYLNDAKESGTVIAGGEPLDRPGYFIAPTIVRDIPDTAPLVRDEQFGPVLPVLSYESLDDAILRANDSEFGLGGTIWTADPERGFEAALKIESGTVWVNRHGLEFDLPLRGAKQSGIGVEYGVEGYLEYTQGKIITMAL
jgi:acyl-CoA reductase-like NAD-dependent aldehyde dehydrogenase